MKTLIALYDTEDTAQSVQTDLIAAGVSQSDIRIEGGSNTHRDDGWTLGGFFNWLFGGDENRRQDADVYAESLRRGDWAVVVECDDASKANVIEDVLYRYNPYDVEQRGEYFRQSGWTAYQPDSPYYSDEEMAMDRQNYRSRYGSDFGDDSPTTVGGQGDTVSRGTIGLGEAGSTTGTGRDVTGTLADDVAAGQWHAERTRRVGSFDALTPRDRTGSFNR